MLIILIPESSKILFKLSVLRTLLAFHSKQIYSLQNVTVLQNLKLICFINKIDEYVRKVLQSGSTHIGL